MVKPGSSVTLLFGQDVLNLVQEGMSGSAVGWRLLIGSKRVFGVVRR